MTLSEIREEARRSTDSFDVDGDDLPFVVRAIDALCDLVDAHDGGAVREIDAAHRAVEELRP